MSYSEPDQPTQPPPRPLQIPGPPAKSILIVDDNATNRKLLRDILQSEGYLTIEAEDGLEALAALERQKVDVVVCDVLMPNMDGYSLCSAIRRRPEFKELFFILYTATDFTADDEKLGLELGADRFISKNGSVSSILKAIDELGTHKSPERHPSGPNGDKGSGPSAPSAEGMKSYNARLVRQLEENSIELEAARQSLRKLNEELEIRVKQRTAQLEVFNTQLEQWVADRTAELAEKNAILELRTAELARSNADLEQFAYAASHDLQEPLRAVSGCIQLFERKSRAGTLGQGGADLVKMVVDGAARMKELIDGLLAYSRAGQDEKLETIDSGLVLQETLENLRVAIAESRAQIGVEDLPSICFGKHQLGHVLQNFLANAIKYRGQAPPEIHLSAERQSDAWVFRIADNGIGFDEQYSEQIFGVFQRLHTRSKYSGTGIGLAIVKRIIERRGGKIWVKSTPGQGSTFFFSVPDNAPLYIERLTP